ncbi:GGDEF and EAL domain-containing protein [Caproiciproducens galactitolivorans]|uniref:bifunctional diguanylate cyclase/phosphodiesterase n=1 Tax=Caproiciproducens galactitolivorans TaxID=642589 RepID=UPI002409C8DF|nr:GGDEF and EAL domain-containing protein [Caproiciproducens galactitolivorans]
MSKKNKMMVAVTILILLLLLSGAGLVYKVQSLLTSDALSMIQEISAQGANAVHVSITENLDFLRTLSDQEEFLKSNDTLEQIRALSKGAERRNFTRIYFADKTGRVVTNDGKIVRLDKQKYFQQAMKGNANVSFGQTDLFDVDRKVITYAVPVIRSHAVYGVIAATADNGNLGILDGIATGPDRSFFLLSSDGSVISRSAGEDSFQNFFQYFRKQSNPKELERIQRDFQQDRPGNGLLTVDGTANLMGYSAIQGTDGWILAVTAEENTFQSQAGKVLFMSEILVAFLILICIACAISFLKFKKNTYEAKLHQEEEINHFIYSDALTDLPNRKGVKKNIREWFECTKCKTGGAFFLDVDNFRSVNNTFGNDVGDEFLAAAASRLAMLTGKNNIIGRIGGDEYALFISNISTNAQLEDFAKKIVELFKKPFLVRKNVIQLTCSIGAVLFNYSEVVKENKFDDIINRGEFVLQEAKKNSKGSYEIYNDQYGMSIERRFQMLSELKLSIYNKELVCYYQPQYDYDKKAVVGFESLARWNSKKFGMVPPLQFIELAEETGFIKQLGRFMINQAFAFAKSISDPGICVSFNASPIELMQADFTDYVIERFCYYELEPESVAIEITESCLIESFDDVVKKLKILTDCGISIYLDDFGTGFSSLSYLKELPIHAVKIDKSFIDNIVSDRVRRDIVDMIIRLAHRLNLKVIAEGVETKEQAQCISECGCNLIQGYYISKPVPGEEAIAFLDELKTG